MPLDTKHTDIFYLVGRLAALAYPGSVADIPKNATDAALRNPITAIPLMERALRKADREAVTEVTEAIPAGAEDFPRGAPITRQMDFWRGYYHQRSAARTAASLSPEMLRKIGEALWGQRWQTEMAAALGFKDPVRIRQFLSGARRPAPGITADLLAIMRTRGVAIEQLADAVEKE